MDPLDPEIRADYWGSNIASNILAKSQDVTGAPTIIKQIKQLGVLIAHLIKAQP